MRLLALLLTAALVACTDLTFGEPGSASTGLSFFTHVEHDSQTRIFVSANLFPGRDAIRKLDVLADSSLYINGTKVTPLVSGGATGYHYLQYDWTVTRPLANTAPESLRVSIPRLALADSFILMLGVPARTDARDLALGPGEDLKLHMTTGAALGVPSTASQFWALRIATLCGQGSALLSTNSQIPYAAETRVPWELLPTTRPQTVEACFQSSLIYDVANMPYRVTVGLSTNVQWIVQLQP